MHLREPSRRRRRRALQGGWSARVRVPEWSVVLVWRAGAWSVDAAASGRLDQLLAYTLQSQRPESQMQGSSTFSALQTRCALQTRVLYSPLPALAQCGACSPARTLARVGGGWRVAGQTPPAASHPRPADSPQTPCRERRGKAIRVNRRGRQLSISGGGRPLDAVVASVRQGDANRARRGAGGVIAAGPLLLLRFSPSAHILEAAHGARRRDLWRRASAGGVHGRPFSAALAAPRRAIERRATVRICFVR